jgi:hypothetical protein
MFHLFKRAYLEFDYKFDSVGYKMLMATDLYNLFPMPTDICPLPTVATFDELLTANFENDVEKFWQFMYEADDKFIAYLKINTVENLLIQYGKSVFQYASEQDHYLWYTSVVESARLRSYIQTSAPDARNQMLRNTFNIKSFEEFKVIYDSQPVSNFLRNIINKQDVSFEYLLPDYLYHGESSLCKEEILDRVRIISIDNWKDELEQLRLETMFGFLDMKVIDPSVNLEVGNIEDQLRNSTLLRWMVDENFSAEPAYIKANYDYQNLVNQWYALEKIWVPGEHNGIEDMFVVNQMIMAEDWESLLHRDIDRNFGCLYTFELFREKSNQIFSTYCYRKKRQNLLSDLAPFRLY